MSDLETAADIVNFYCLTLKEREHDRKPKAKIQINNFLNGCNGEKNFRFFEMNKKQNKHTDGAFGRFLGHIGMLEKAIADKLSHVVMCEDDIKFTDIPKLKSDIDVFLESKIAWDVLLLQGLNYKPYKASGKLWYKVTCCEAPGCYLVKSSYFQVLLNHFSEGQDLLRHSKKFPKDNPHGGDFGETYNFEKFSLDMYWKLLQVKDNWFIPRKLTCVQENSYSDIDEANTPFTQFKEERMSKHQIGEKDVPLSENEIASLTDVEEKAKQIKLRLKRLKIFQKKYGKPSVTNIGSSGSSSAKKNSKVATVPYGSSSNSGSKRNLDDTEDDLVEINDNTSNKKGRNEQNLLSSSSSSVSGSDFARKKALFDKKK
jgi:hypothetical protein